MVVSKSHVLQDHIIMEQNVFVQGQMIKNVNHGNIGMECNASISLNNVQLVHNGIKLHVLLLVVVVPLGSMGRWVIVRYYLNNVHQAQHGYKKRKSVNLLVILALLAPTCPDLPASPMCPARMVNHGTPPGFCAFAHQIQIGMEISVYLVPVGRNGWKVEVVNALSAHSSLVPGVIVSTLPDAPTSRTLTGRTICVCVRKVLM